MSSASFRPLFRRIDEIAPLIDRGFAVLTPNRRLARAIRAADGERRAATGLTAWAAPQISPERQFWSEVWRRGVTCGRLPAQRILDVPAQRLLWQDVIERDGDSGFSLLNPQQASSLCQEAFDNLLFWQLDPEIGRWKSWFDTDDDARIFLSWARLFQKRLTTLEACTSAQAHTEVLAAVGRGIDLDVPPIVRILCDDATPLHIALAEHAPERIDIDLPDGRAHPAAILSFEDGDAELRAAARWCRERAEQVSEGRFAVVLQDMHAQRAVFETHLRREFECLTTNYDALPVNFATGFNLGHTSIVRDALRALGFACRDVDVEDCIALLQSRFIAPLGLTPAALERCARALRDLAAPRVPGTVLRELLAHGPEGDAHPSPWEAHLLLESQGLGLRRRQTPSAWVSIFRRLLDVWGWGTGVALDSLEYQQHTSWHDALDSFAALDGVLPNLILEEGLAALRRFLNDLPFQPQTSDRAIQVLGPLETSGLTFDGLWITGMDAGTWPQRPRPNPYLPVSIQRSLAMPGCDAGHNKTAALRRAEHWRSCTPELRVTFQGLRDEAEQLPSPVFPGTEVRAGETGSAFDPRWLEQADAHREAVPWIDVPLEATEKAAQGAGSAVLEAQAACPFRAFAQFRLAAGPSPAPHVGLAPSERGAMLHHALHRIFSDLAESATLSSTASAGKLDEALEAAVAEGRRAIGSRRRLIVGPDALALEEQRLRELLRRWLELELQRPGDFRVVGREVERTLTLKGLHLNLRIDRIDELDEGGRIILDYKSGAPETLTRWFSEPPTSTQMPLYALAEPEATAVVHAVVRPGEEQWRGVGVSSYLPGISPVSDWVAVSTNADEVPSREDPAHSDATDQTAAFAAQRSVWRRDLEHLAAAFVAGVSPVEPLEGACRTCQRYRLCRIGDAA